MYFSSTWKHEQINQKLADIKAINDDLHERQHKFNDQEIKKYRNQISTLESASMKLRSEYGVALRLVEDRKWENSCLQEVKQKLELENKQLKEKLDSMSHNEDELNKLVDDLRQKERSLQELVELTNGKKLIKVENYINNMATFFNGLVIGFINYLKIALITLVTSPFIAAREISTIFLYRHAENIEEQEITKDNDDDEKLNALKNMAE